MYQSLGATSRERCGCGACGQVVLLSANRVGVRGEGCVVIGWAVDAECNGMGGDRVDESFSSFPVFAEGD